MNIAETPAPVEPTAADLKSKTLLVISSPNPKKKFIYTRLKELGPKMILLASEENWVSKLADGFLQADPLDEVACAAKVEELVKTMKIDGVITFWENAVPLAATLAQRFGWVGNTAQAALNARNKYLTRQTLENAKLSKYQPAWALIKSHTDLEKAAARIGFPLVLKPAWGVKSQFVVKLDSLDEAKKAFDYIKTNMTPAFDPIYKSGTDILAEEYLDGAEIDVDLLVQGGEVKFHAFTDNFPTKEPFFIETGDAMPSRHEAKDLADVLKMAKEVLAALGLTSGALHLEAKITPTGVKLIELNARMGGDYLYDWIKTVWETDIIEEASKIAVGFPSQPKRLKEPRCHLVGRYLIPEHSGVVVGVKLPQEKADPVKVHDISVQKEPGDAALVPPEGFETMGWVIGRGDTYAEAEENLDAAVAQGAGRRSRASIRPRRWARRAAEPLRRGAGRAAPHPPVGAHREGPRRGPREEASARRHPVQQLRGRGRRGEGGALGPDLRRAQHPEGGRIEGPPRDVLRHERNASSFRENRQCEC